MQTSIEWWVYLLLGVLILLFVLSAIFSGSETAYATVSPAKVHEMVEEEQKFSKLISRQIKRFNQTLSTILIANNLVNIGSATLTSYLLARIFSGNQNLIPIISTAVVTPILVLCGEITPKLIAKSHAVKWLKIFAIFNEIMFYIFFIFTYPISKLSKKVYVTNSEEDLKNIISLAQSEGVLQTGESLLAQNALDLDSTKVAQHYIRLKDVLTLNYKTSITDALKIFKQSNYSRIPVEKDGVLIGIVLLKDIFHVKNGRVIDFMKNVPLISANSILSSALEKMRANRAQMAFVVENNNSTDIIGLITIEDIIEEIVGELYDEYDNDEAIYEISLEKSHVHASAQMSDIFKQLEIDDDLLEENEGQMNLRSWLLFKTNRQKLTKNTRYTLDDEVTFKVIEIPKNKKEETIIEINKL
ncbi:DUF21 domain-containing protein [Mycoplasma sp. Pen4]|nr:DUF21 domain-containing protein [Mycoplasma sp. Pen4]